MKAFVEKRPGGGERGGQEEPDMRKMAVASSASATWAAGWPRTWSRPGMRSTPSTSPLRRSARRRGNGCVAPHPRAEAVQGVDAVVTMLPTGEHRRERLYRRRDRPAPTTALLLDCSTIDVATARKVEASARRRLRDGRCAGFGRHRRGQRRHADLHGRRRRSRFATRRGRLEPMGKAVIHAGGHRHRAGRQDLQQHAAGAT